MTTPPDWSNPDVRNGTRRMLDLRSERLAAGDRSIGWKLAFGAPASLERFNLSSPLVGFLTDGTVKPSGSTVSCEGWRRPVAEPEIAVYFGEDVRRDNVAASITGIGAAIELANVDPSPENIEEMLAGDIFHKAVVFGEPDMTRQGGDRSGLRSRVWHDDSEVVNTTDFEQLTGDLVEVVTHASNLLAAAGAGFSPGDIVIIGSITPPIAIQPGQRVTFELSPMASISIHV